MRNNTQIASEIPSGIMVSVEDWASGGRGYEPRAIIFPLVGKRIPKSLIDARTRNLVCFNLYVPI